ncbi:ATP phosphoribosyltransferase regulatory subunit [Aureimonas populi]|uniref:Histidine--tRNA ligase n=1 Tax=Aureimonas populi TaxID=1701758 RepID=A0ABW5CHN2_9HYPH|nr:ATP phosphoribosyltransferase regulatory subunit [Aureimonas populi]
MNGLPPFEEGLRVFFRERGAQIVDVPVLQPAEPYLDTAGEALRRRIFLTRGEGGRSLCLRPDFTIPVAIAHIERGEALPQRYAYSGIVFRQDREGSAEFRQAGIEDLGTPDVAGADAAAVADAAHALAACGVAPGAAETVLGDQALFEAFLRTLGLPAGWQRRLIGTFGHDEALRSALEGLASGSGAASIASVPERLLDLARAGDEARLTEEIASRMEEGGLPPNRGRTPGEVARRLIEKVAVAEARLDAGLLARLRRFLAIDCPLSEAQGELAALGGHLGPSLTLFASRNEALGAAGLDLSRIRYRAAFGRPLDYYTGMVFEMSVPGAAGPLAGGGRYDRLVSYLGAPEPIPAVGFSLWLDRLAPFTESLA